MDIKVVIADSSPLSRIGLRAILAQKNDIEIVGEAENSQILIEQVQSFKPDIILIDYSKEVFDSKDIHHISKKFPKSYLIGITSEQTSTSVINSLKVGIKSHIKKDCSVGEILDSVYQTHKGDRFFCGQILDLIKEASIDLVDIEDEVFSCDPVVLSSRELEIIKLIAEGYTNVQIADKLFLSSHTVNTHRKNIMNKLGVKNTAGIVIYAVKSNLVSPNKYLFATDV